MNVFELIEAHGLTLHGDIEHFAALVAAHEREECITLVHAGTGEPIQTKTLFILQKDRKRIEDAIRARETT